MTPKRIQTRCLWCVKRNGAPRYLVCGQWIEIFSVPHFLGEVDFTDTICPECLRLERLKLVKPMKPGLDDPEKPFMLNTP